MAMGESRAMLKRLFEEDPLMGVMWEEYDLCRAFQWVYFPHKSKDGKTEYPIHAQFPSHIATWPAAGGILDQPYLYVKVFRAFLEGEREGTMRRIEKMRKD